MAIQNMLNSLCDMEVCAVAIDPATGDKTRTWTTVEKDIPCRLRGRERSKGFYDGLNGPLEWRRASHVLYMEKRDIDPLEHHIRIDGKTHRILGALDMGGKGRISIVFLEQEA